MPRAIWTYATVERLPHTLELQLQITAVDLDMPRAPIRMPLITESDYRAAVDRFVAMDALKPAEGSPISAELLVLSAAIALYEQARGLPASVQYIH